MEVRLLQLKSFCRPVWKWTTPTPEMLSSLGLQEVKSPNSTATQTMNTEDSTMHARSNCWVKSKILLYFTSKLNYFSNNVSILNLKPVSQLERQTDRQTGITSRQRKSLGPESKTRPPFKLSLMPPDSQVLIGHRFRSSYTDITHFYAEHIQMHLKHLKFQL